MKIEVLPSPPLLHNTGQLDSKSETLLRVTINGQKAHLKIPVALLHPGAFPDFDFGEQPFDLTAFLREEHDAVTATAEADE